MTLLSDDPLWVTRKPINAVRNRFKTRRTQAQLPPGPKGRPFIGVLREFNADPFTYLRDCAEEYGDVFRVPLPLLNVVAVNNPDHVGHIMANTTGAYSMIGPYQKAAHLVLGRTIPILEGEPFKERRKLLTPMFRHSALSDLASTIVEEFTHRIDAWDQWADTGRTVDLQHEIAWVTMPAFMRAMFGVTPSDEEISQLDSDLRMILKTFAAAIFLCPPPNPVPLPGIDSLPAAWRRIRKYILGQIQQRRAHPIEGSDLLQVLLDARYEDGTRISDKDLIAELAILIAGGYETVVSSVSWTLALLAENPDAAQQLITEVDHLGGAAPTYEDLGDLSWVKACFDEAQRLQGHPFHPRIALRDDEIGGYFIPRGTIVGVSMYALHRDARWWPEPEKYDPSRFTSKAVAAGRPPLAFIPFGAGQHRCIGSQLGYMNAQFILALIHQRYRIHTAPGWTPKHASTFSTTIEGGLPVTLTRA